MREIRGLIRDTIRLIKLLDNYSIPEQVRIKKSCDIFKRAMKINYKVFAVLHKGYAGIFDNLIEDIVKKCKIFCTNKHRTIEGARSLASLILSNERYLFDVANTKWELGAKISKLEKFKLKRLFKKEFHKMGEVRGTQFIVMVCGSLARGYSDYKFLHKFVPKPSDYNLPREYRKDLDRRLSIHEKLKPKFSDVDIFIMNKVLFECVHPDMVELTRGYIYKLGEKYGSGLGGCRLLKNLHVHLETTNLGGVS